MSGNRSNRIGRFLVGMGLEVAAKITYAPRLGREIRQAIQSGVDNGRECLTSVGREARHRLSNWVNAGKEMISDKKRQGNATIDIVLKGVQRDTAEKQS
jgi:hypothetical protein